MGLSPMPKKHYEWISRIAAIDFDEHEARELAAIGGIAYSDDFRNELVNAVQSGLTIIEADASFASIPDVRRELRTFAEKCNNLASYLRKISRGRTSLDRAAMLHISKALSVSCTDTSTDLSLYLERLYDSLIKCEASVADQRGRPKNLDNHLIFNLCAIFEKNRGIGTVTYNHSENRYGSLCYSFVAAVLNHLKVRKRLPKRRSQIEQVIKRWRAQAEFDRFVAYLDVSAMRNEIFQPISEETQGISDVEK